MLRLTGDFPAKWLMAHTKPGFRGTFSCYYDECGNCLPIAGGKSIEDKHEEPSYLLFRYDKKVIPNS